jgi:hypothetical protein
MRGLDVTILAMVPMMVGLYLGYTPLTVMVVQALFSVGIVLLSVLSKPRRA